MVRNAQSSVIQGFLLTLKNGGLSPFPRPSWRGGGKQNFENTPQKIFRALRARINAQKFFARFARDWYTKTFTSLSATRVPKIVVLRQICVTYVSTKGIRRRCRCACFAILHSLSSASRFTQVCERFRTPNRQIRFELPNGGNVTLYFLTCASPHLVGR